MAERLQPWKNSFPQSLAVPIMLHSLKTQIDSSVKSVRHLLQRPLKLEEGNITLGKSREVQIEEERDAQRRLTRRMRRDLYQLLSQHPSSRKLLRHLALVERTLHERGIPGFEALPIGVIAKALGELERLVWDWSPRGLAELRSRMAVAVKEQRLAQRTAAAQSSAAPASKPPAATEVADDIPDRLMPTLTAVVTEVDHAEFEEMERSWAGVVPRPDAVVTAAKAA